MVCAIGLYIIYIQYKILLVTNVERFFFSESAKKSPKWNFWKFLVSPEGKVVRFWRTEEPMESVRQDAVALVRDIILKKRVEL